MGHQLALIYIAYIQMISDVEKKMEKRMEKHVLNMYKSLYQGKLSYFTNLNRSAIWGWFPYKNHRYSIDLPIDKIIDLPCINHRYTIYSIDLPS